MDVKFVTGSINLGQQKSMDDIIASVTGKREVKTASKVAEVKTAEEKDCDEEDEDCDDEDKDKDCTAEAKVETKKAEVDEAADELVEEEDAEAGDEEVKETEAKVETKIAKDTKEATKKPQFIKIAKMTPQTRNFLREYWATIYPTEYVEAILAEN